MKTKLILLLVSFALCLPAFAGKKKKADKETEQFRYELQCAGNAAQGTYLVKVYSYSKKANIAAEQCKKNAVHGVIFKGYGNENGCVAQRPLVQESGAELEHKDFFDLFFQDGGEYMKYVQVTSTPQDVVKVGREYKVGVVVVVRKDALRKALEGAGIVRGLNSIF